MTGKAHLPPVPPASRSPHGEASPHQGGLPAAQAQENKDSRNRHLEQQGRQGNTKQNTTHQGYQQDR